MASVADRLRERFGALDWMTRRKNITEPEPKQEYTEADRREDALETLSQYPEMSSTFIPMLEERVEQLERQVPQAMESHAKLCYLEGGKSELQTLIRLFEQFTEGE